MKKNFNMAGIIVAGAVLVGCSDTPSGDFTQETETSYKCRQGNNYASTKEYDKYYEYRLKGNLYTSTMNVEKEATSWTIADYKKIAKHYCATGQWPGLTGPATP